MTSHQKLVLPGERLAHIDDYIAGPGCYCRLSAIHACLVGYPKIIKKDDDDDKPIMLVVQKKQASSVVPSIGDQVTVRVKKINPRLASVEILCVEGRPLRDTYSGVIRVQDVRATEIDKVEIYKSFRPGDIVRAQVISLGTSRSYFLSTAANQYGVIWALSVSSVPMIPVSWQSMQCPKTKMLESRKVAKTTTTTTM
mmetsp:Transcript_19270/g.28704  ORF Transcript_19270/g.28704 Transcript_19270/m.28704 type:complete len:197 (+) Transcript_19270:58-648(+)|eukprot:CAMPEP_0201552404 /NCGR_PEP_ID=MMETSP0173_2-20130828/15968_1 /ASSEMBLY_ACC=CAM_ASM_000268 /TAXON_ID=218659 /ORGANISM="Vexillifera sp., Strain DIVA3 564/2" /LENGTH=196 /DNA_ID=CAMNT_0047962887 /DNA_START=32 /DNA_END=625 /DNA_ORIENTATION=-